MTFAASASETNAFGVNKTMTELTLGCGENDFLFTFSCTLMSNAICARAEIPR